MEVIYNKLTDTNNIDFFDSIEIYKESFPSNERQPLKLIKERVEKGLSELHVGYLGNEIVCIAFLWYFNDSEYVLLDYMAVIRKYRNNYIGGNFFKFLTQKAINEKKYLIFEVEDFQYGNNIEQRKQRINFYIKNGAYILQDIPYLLPSLDNTQPTEMLLMISPNYLNNQISKTKIQNLITRLYLELYNKSEKDILLNSILKKIPSKIVLINEILK
jgi:hypothetical protein